MIDTPHDTPVDLPLPGAGPMWACSLLSALLLALGVMAGNKYAIVTESGFTAEEEFNWSAFAPWAIGSAVCLALGISAFAVCRTIAIFVTAHAR